MTGDLRFGSAEHLTGLPVRNAAHLGQLVEQVRAAGSAPGGVGQDQVRAPRGGPANGVVHDGPGIGAFVGAHEVGARPLGPLAQLVSRRRAERVPGRQDHLVALKHLARRDLADGRRLAHAVHADEQPHPHPTRIGIDPQAALGHQGGAQRGAHGGRHALGSTPFELVQHRRRGSDPHVAAQQHLFDQGELLGAHGAGGEPAQAVKDAARPPEPLGQVDRGLRKGRPRLDRRDQDVGQRGGRRGGRNRTPPAAAPAYRACGDGPHDHDGADDGPRIHGADHATTSRVTRWETTFEDPPGTMVTP